MALKLKWTKRSKTSFDKVIRYLDNRFGGNTKKAFVRKSFTIIENLQEFPDLGTIEILDKNILLNFFDTRQNSNKKVFKTKG